jgi:hypothetical protein
MTNDKRQMTKEYPMTKLQSGFSFFGHWSFGIGHYPSIVVSARSNLDNTLSFPSTAIK